MRRGRDDISATTGSPAMSARAGLTRAHVVCVLRAGPARRRAARVVEELLAMLHVRGVPAGALHHRVRRRAPIESVRLRSCLTRTRYRACGFTSVSPRATR